MAKRKRTATLNSPSKRARGGPLPSPLQQHPHGQVDPDREYKLESIIDEDDTRYLISWEDDEETGEKNFEDTWEPKRFVNRVAVRDWQRQKAEKQKIADRRIPERQNSRAVQSSSNSVKSTPLPNSPVRAQNPGKSLRLQLKAGKVESSSPLAQEPQTDEEGERTAQHVDELLEIGESQHSESGTQPAPNSFEPDPDSSLFVPAASPSSSELSEPPEALVHISEPPSSYFAGGYEAGFSAQAVPNSTPLRNKSLEPSQYVPDPVDTSTTTADTNEVTLPPTTPSEQAKPDPNTTGQSSVKRVPDSQSLPGSSSFVPSDTTTDRSLPSQIQHTDSNKEQSVSTNKDQDAQVASIGPGDLLDQDERNQTSVSEVDTRSKDYAERLSSSGRHSSPLREEQRVLDEVQGVAVGDQINPAESRNEEISGRSIDQVQATDEAIEVGKNLSEQQTLPNNDDSTPGEQDKGAEAVSERDLSNSVTLAQRADQSDGSGEIDNEAIATEIETSRSHSPHSPKRPESESEEHHSASQSGHLHIVQNPVPSASSTIQPTSAQPEVVDEIPDNPVEKLNVPKEVSNDLDSSTQSAQSDLPRTQATSVGVTPDSQLLENPPTEPIPPSAGTTGQQATDPSKTNHIDFTATSQDCPTSISQFPVTPPSRTLPLASHYPGPRLPSSSASFPFQTQPPGSVITSRETGHPQVSRPVSAGTPFSSAVLDRPNFQSQPPLESHTQLGHISPFTARATSLPFSRSPPADSSSSIAPVPSQSIGIGVFGDSAPQNLAISSDTLPRPSFFRTMDASQTHPELSRASLKVKLEAMYAMHRKKHRDNMAAQGIEIATSTPTENVSTVDMGVRSAVPAWLASPLLRAADGPRSPSAVPHLEPLPEIVQEEQTTTSRYETLLPRSRENGQNGGQSNGSLTTVGTLAGEQNGAEQETATLFTVPVSMTGHQRDHYPIVVSYHETTIRRFLEAEDADPRLLTQAKDFVERMRKITMHPDLDNAETMTQYEVEPRQQANWDVDCSAKFRFLKELFNCTRDEKLHIVIIASPGRIINMLETFLQGIEVSYIHLGVPASPKESAHKGSTRATLLSADVEGVKTDPADLVIAMDNFVSHDSPQVRALRQHDDKWAPFISLVVPRTVEHVERSVSPSLADRARSRALVSGIYQFREDAGRLEEGQQPPKETAVAIARYLRNVERSAEWPISPLTVLQDLESQTQNAEEHPQERSNGTQDARSGEKRPRDLDDTRDDAACAAKKARVAPLSMNPEDVETTHISDSIDKTTQSNDAGTQAEGPSPQLSNNEKRLQDLLIKAQDRIEEHSDALKALQFRHEDQRNQLLEATTERNNATFTAERAATRFGEQSNTMSMLRVKNAELERQLKEANEKLLEHSVPERAEFEALRLAAAQSNNEKEKLQKRLEQAQKDLEYIRGLYQNSSNSAQQSATQTAELENQLAVVQNRATGEQVRLRQMGYDTFTKSLQSENKRLKAIVKDRDTAVRFRDDEITRLKEASRGRMGTRGTSVPQSPRIQSPVKPDARVGSRHTSPMPGEPRSRSGLLHPLRNS